MSKYFNWKNGIDKKELEYCVQILQNGGVIVFPTETVYAIAVNATLESAVEKLYKIKNRSLKKPVNIMVGSAAQIKEYANINNELEKNIIENFMPGPITIILEKKENISNLVTANNSTVGVRIPNNIIAVEILKKSNFPIVASSANLSGEQSGINIEQIKKDFDDVVDIFIDGGISKLSNPSTIVEIINNEIVIHRQGNITISEIKNKIYKGE